MSELPSEGTKKIYAPDRSSAIKFTSDGVFLVFPAGKETDLSDFVGSMNLTEFKYAGDSDGLFMNSSLGGLVGDWHTHVYRFKSGVADEIDIPLILQSVGLPKSTPGCAPNIYSIAWLDVSKKLLVLAEVPPSSGCENTRASHGYVIDLDNKSVDESYTLKEYVRKFGSLILRTDGAK